jgi:hypothetical protein
MVVNGLDARKAYELTEHLAYQLWEHRGQPLGSPEVDWHAAEKYLASVLGEPNLDWYVTAMEPHERNCR